MSSISKEELISCIENYPDDAEVIMEISTKYDVKAGTSIAYINGIMYDEIHNEIRLMN